MNKFINKKVTEKFVYMQKEYYLCTQKQFQSSDDRTGDYLQ